MKNELKRKRKRMDNTEDETETTSSETTTPETARAKITTTTVPWLVETTRRPLRAIKNQDSAKDLRETTQAPRGSPCKPSTCRTTAGAPGQETTTTRRGYEEKRHGTTPAQIPAEWLLKPLRATKQQKTNTKLETTKAPPVPCLRETTIRPHGPINKPELEKVKRSEREDKFKSTSNLC